MQTKTAVRRVSLLLAAVLLLSLCGCGTTAQPSVAAAKKDAASAPLAVWFFDAGKADAILLTTDQELAKAVAKEIDGFIEELPRTDIICKSIENYGYIFVGETMDELIDAANTIASEHLEIITENAFEVMTRIRNAGAIFLGSYSSEPLGDYYAGPNHILPTNGTARFFSPLGVDTIKKKSSIISYSKDALRRVHNDIEVFAENEGLYAHANSIRVRFEEE